MLPLEPCVFPLHLINLSSWNHGKKNDPAYGYVSPYLLCNMNNMLPLQYSSAANDTSQPEHRSISLSMTILGPVQASKSCHTKHHEVNDMSMNELIHHVPKHVPIMHNIHVHQHHTMCHMISSMECINHMPLPTCQPCASTNMRNK